MSDYLYVYQAKEGIAPRFIWLADSREGEKDCVPHTLLGRIKIEQVTESKDEAGK